jgi:hypothetical protein
MKLKTLAFITFSVMSFVGPAKSAVKVQKLYTGEVMLVHCAGEPPFGGPASDNPVYKGICIGYLSGIYDAQGRNFPRGRQSGGKSEGSWAAALPPQTCPIRTPLNGSAVDGSSSASGVLRFFSNFLREG